MKIRFFEKVTEHFVLGVDSNLEQNDGFRRFRVFDCYVAAKLLGIFFKKSNFQKLKNLTGHFCSLTKLVTSVRGWDAQSRISRGGKIPVIPENHQFEHFWRKSLRESYQKIRRILGFSRNSSNFDDLYLRAQGELGARTTCVGKAST